MSRAAKSLLAGAAAFIVAGGCSDRGAPAIDEPARTEIAPDAALDAIFAAWDVPGSPGCGLAIAQDGELIYSRGYGYANLDYDVPITPQTVFDVASVTKQFNASAINMLALDGKLSLDDDIRRWLPEIPEYEQPITIRHLLYHTSGLRDYLNLFPLAGRGDYYPISLDQIVEMMARQRAIAFPPGEQYDYSNTGYMLLAKIIERAGGVTLAEIAEERMFEPLGMNGSIMYGDLTVVIPQRAIGYDRDDDGTIRIVHNYNFDIPGDGQLYTTMEDLLLWAEYLHGGESPPFYAELMTEGLLNSGEGTGYAQGLVLGEYRGLETVRHSGGSWGFLTQFVRFVEPRLTIALSCNSNYSNPQELVHRVAEHYLEDQMGPAPEVADDSDDQEQPYQRVVPSLNEEQLAEFTGEFFSSELDATYRLTVEDSGLVLRVEQEAPVPVSPVAADSFEIGLHDEGLSGRLSARLDFDRNRAGSVTGFGLSSRSERGIIFERR